MHTVEPNIPFNFTLPFVGRSRESRRLQQIHARRAHALILGPAGVGKSTLVARLSEKLALLVCPDSARLGSICQALEARLGLEAGNAKLPQRLGRLRHTLEEAGRTVVFDGVGWTTPKLSSFLESVMGGVPVWICTRSEHPWDIGHFWPLLVRLERIELPPFRPAETRELIAAAVNTGLIPRAALNLADRLHRRSGGCPRVLHAWLEQMARRAYDLSDPQVLRRLDLDRRVHELFPLTPADR